MLENNTGHCFKCGRDLPLDSFSGRRIDCHGVIKSAGYCRECFNTYQNAKNLIKKPKKTEQECINCRILQPIDSYPYFGGTKRRSDQCITCYQAVGAALHKRENGDYEYRKPVRAQKTDLAKPTNGDYFD